MGYSTAMAKRQESKEEGRETTWGGISWVGSRRGRVEKRSQKQEQNAKGGGRGPRQGGGEITIKQGKDVAVEAKSGHLNLIKKTRER